MLLVQKAFWRTRALSAFAKLYAALRMHFLRLLYAYFSTDLFGTFFFHFTANLVFHSFQLGDGSLFKNYIRSLVS